jgi:hypothetical protein
MQNIIGLLVTFLTLAASGVTGSDFYTSTYLPVQLMQRIKRFVRILCRLAFISRAAIFDPRKRAMERIEIETYSLYNARKEFGL